MPGTDLFDYRIMGIMVPGTDLFDYRLMGSEYISPVGESVRPGPPIADQRVTSSSTTTTSRPVPSATVDQVAHFLGGLA